MPNSETFIVGEIAILCNATAWREYEGMECTVIEPLRLRRGHIRDTGEIVEVEGYRVQAADGKRFCAMPGNLRKKRPPREDLALVNWSECRWWPEEILRKVRS